MKAVDKANASPRRNSSLLNRGLTLAQTTGKTKLNLELLIPGTKLATPVEKSTWNKVRQR